MKCEYFKQLLADSQEAGFRLRIVTGNEKWVDFRNAERRNPWLIISVWTGGHVMCLVEYRGVLHFEIVRIVMLWTLTIMLNNCRKFMMLLPSNNRHWPIEDAHSYTITIHQKTFLMSPTANLINFRDSKHCFEQPKYRPLIIILPRISGSWLVACAEAGPNIWTRTKNGCIFFFF